MKKIILLSFLCIFVTAPVLAKIVSMSMNSSIDSQEEATPPSKEDIHAAILDKNQSLPKTDRFNSDFSVASTKKIDGWWYIATITIDNVQQSLLLAVHSNGHIRVLTLPGETLPYYNISGSQGVPYDVIDELNKLNTGD